MIYSRIRINRALNEVAFQKRLESATIQWREDNQRKPKSIKFSLNASEFQAHQKSSKENIKIRELQKLLRKSPRWES